MALSRLRGVGAASRGTATLGAAAVLPYRAESFGVFVPDDDPEEPERAKDCPEYVKAEECRAAGCEWTKKTAACAHWALKNAMGQPKPPPGLSKALRRNDTKRKLQEVSKSFLDEVEVHLAASADGIKVESRRRSPAAYGGRPWRHILICDASQSANAVESMTILLGLSR